MKLWCVLFLVIIFFRFSRFNCLLQEILHSLVWSVFFLQTYGRWVFGTAFSWGVHLCYRMYYDILCLENWCLQALLCFVVYFFSVRLNKTPTWCNKIQILLLQTFSTCFGRHAPIISSIKYWHGTATGTGSSVNYNIGIALTSWPRYVFCCSLHVCVCVVFNLCVCVYIYIYIYIYIQPL